MPAKALYSAQEAAEMSRRRRYYCDVSEDGGKTFTRYRSAGAFYKATGRSIGANFQTNAIFQSGGPALNIGDETKPLPLIIDRVPSIVKFVRKR